MKKPVVKHILGLLLTLAVAAVFALGGEAVMQRKLNSLPAEQKVDTVIALTDCTVSGAADEAAGEEEEEGFEEDPEEGLEEGLEEEEGFAGDEAAEEAAPSLRLKTDAQTLTIPFNGYVDELTLTGTVAANQKYIISCRLPDGSVKGITSYFISGLNQDSAHIGMEVTSLTVRMTKGEAQINTITVNNTPVRNTRRMVLFGLAAAALFALVWWRRDIGEHIELGFLIVALAVGIFLSVCLPCNVNFSFDDQIHLVNAYDGSWGLHEYSSAFSDAMEFMVWSYQNDTDVLHVLDTARDDRLMRAQQDAMTGESVVDKGSRSWQFNDVGYLPSSAGIAVSRLLGAKCSVQFMAGRVCNMLFYVLVCFAAIAVLRRFKVLMAAVALAPGAMFLACNYSYDPLCSALCWLGIALTVDAILDRDTRLSWQRALAILLCFLIGSLTKVVYMPLMLLVLLLPKGKFDSARLRVWYKLAAAVICLIGVAAMVMNVTGDTTVLLDTRADAADTAGQLEWIKGHPLQYLGYFFTYIVQYFTIYFTDVWRTSWGYVGSVENTLAFASLMLLVFAVVTDNDPEMKQKMNWKLRLGFLIIGGLVVGMVFTTMYAAFSPVGAYDFGGVQSRYFLPVLPLLYMILSPDGIRNSMNKTGWHTVFCIANLVILSICCYTMVIAKFFL